MAAAAEVTSTTDVRNFGKEVHYDPRRGVFVYRAPTTSKEQRAINAWKRQSAMRQNKRRPASTFTCSKKTKTGLPCRRAATMGAEGEGLCSQHGSRRVKRDAYCGYVTKSGNNKNDPFVVPDDDGKRHGH